MIGIDWPMVIIGAAMLATGWAITVKRAPLAAFIREAQRSAFGDGASARLVRSRATPASVVAAGVFALVLGAFMVVAGVLLK